MSMLGRDFAGTFAARFRGRLRTVVLEHLVPGTPTSGALTDGTNPTFLSYTADGLPFDGTVEVLEDRIGETQTGVLIMAATLKRVLASSPASVVPGIGDRFTVDGATYTVTKVDTDPAAATHSLWGV
jgi:hypothetical protein